MRARSLWLPLLAAVFLMTFATSSCAARVGVGYRVYDPYRSDYHTWDDRELGYYDRWTVETRRPHREFRKLNRDQQREYWRWRHEHP